MELTEDTIRNLLKEQSKELSKELSKEQDKKLDALRQDIGDLRENMKVMFEGIIDTVNRKEQTAFRQAQAGQFYQPTEKYADGSPSGNYFHPNSNSRKSNSVY